MHSLFQKQQDRIAQQKGVNLRLQERLQDKDILVASMSSQQVSQQSQHSLLHHQEREENTLKLDAMKFKSKQDLQRYLSQMSVLRQSVQEVG